ncbi:F-box protein At4g22280-like [Carex rostrata]
MMKARGNEENDDIDRISSLPDEVCMHILSFVSTKEAVQTCILSKRWINTWASVPDLKFDIKEFRLPKIIAKEFSWASEKSLTNLRFERVLRSVLEKRDTSCVNRFQLCSDWHCTQAIVNCIGDVIKLGPRECLLEMCSGVNFNLKTDVIFSCASLIYLQLKCPSTEYFFLAIEPNSINLPCLKTLNLDGVKLTDDSLKKLLLGCPVLEELVLKGSYFAIIEIYSNTLKKLVLCSPFDVMRLQISTPNLVYLDIRVCSIPEIMLLNMPSLVDASIIFDDWDDQDSFQEYREIYVTMGRKLIHSLSNVECLQLEFNYPDGEVLMKDFSDFPIFNNLKRLKLLDWRFDGFDLAFLLHSPELQELTLSQSYPYSTFDAEITQEKWGDALVQREFLKTVRIVGFKNDTRFVDHLINKLLVHVKVIGKIDIV